MLNHLVHIHTFNSSSSSSLKFCVQLSRHMLQALTKDFCGPGLERDRRFWTFWDSIVEASRTSSFHDPILTPIFQDGWWTNHRQCYMLFFLVLEVSTALSPWIDFHILRQKNMIRQCCVQRWRLQTKIPVPRIGWKEGQITSQLKPSMVFGFPFKKPYTPED